MTIEATDVDAIASIQDVEAILDKLLLEEAEVDAKLEHLLNPNNQPDLTSLTNLQSSITIQDLLSQLNERIGPVAETASGLSERVKKLDIEQARIKECLKYVEDVQELKSCIIGVYDAMEKKDWDEAATFIHQASLLDTSIINGPLAMAAVPTSEIPDPPTVFLSQASDALFKLFLREFDAAAKVKDEERITRFFRLFPLIGKENEGLDVYGRFVCGIIAGRSRAAMTQSTSSPMFFASTLTALFENIARIVETHTSLVDRFYGTGKMVRVIQRLQGECDRQGGIILDSLWDERHIQRKLAETKSYAFNFLVQSFLPAPPSSSLVRSTTDQTRFRTGSPSPAANGTEETIDSKAIDSLLNEISVVLSRWNLYIKFVAVKCQYDSLQIEIPQFIKTAALAHKIFRIRASFESLETFFFRRSVEKAFQLDEPSSHQSGPPTTSVIDDVMFVFRKVLDRSLGTGDAELLKTICANTRRILDLDFAGIIKRRITMDSQRSVSGKGGEDVGRRERIRGLVAELNNLDISRESIIGLTEGYIGGNLEGLFPFGDHLEVARAALMNVGNLKERFDTYLHEGLATLFSQLVKPGIKRLVNEMFAGVHYLLTQQEYDELLVEEVVTRRFAMSWDALILPFKDDLTSSNFQSLLNLSVKYLVDPLEKKLWSSRVNELGAIRLEKDISQITTYATRLGPYNLRERFAWCQQICIVLNFDTEGIPGGVEGAANRILEEESGEGWRLDKEDLIRLLEEVKVTG